MSQRKETTGPPVKMDVPDRHAKFLELWLKSNNIRQSAISAGFSEQTASKAGKGVLKTAIKRHLELVPPSKANNTNYLASKLQMTGDEILGEFSKVIKQDRDLNSKLKALRPFLKEQGIDLEEEKVNINVPVLNIGVKDLTQQAIDPQPTVHNVE